MTRGSGLSIRGPCAKSKRTYIAPVGAA